METAVSVSATTGTSVNDQGTWDLTDKGAKVK
jgi:hypothetical protein